MHASTLHSVTMNLPAQWNTSTRAQANNSVRAVITQLRIWCWASWVLFAASILIAWGAGMQENPGTPSLWQSLGPAAGIGLYLLYRWRSSTLWARVYRANLPSRNEPPALAELSN